MSVYFCKWLALVVKGVWCEGRVALPLVILMQLVICDMN